MGGLSLVLPIPSSSFVIQAFAFDFRSLTDNKVSNSLRGFTVFTYCFLHGIETYDLVHF